MQIARDIASVRAAVQAARQSGRRIGFVPTMGALHRGHVSLIEAARRDGTYVVVSMFVNPTQFGPQEDFTKYPRDEAGDLRICEQTDVELVFIPPLAEMYAPDAVTTVRVAKLTETLCGPLRPGHFDGVATVCAKLFHIVQPDMAYFGQKDAQQIAVIRRMVRDLDLPLEIVGCPTIREENGLALSSRNQYLTPTERRQAACLYRALCAGGEQIRSGERAADRVVSAMRRQIEEAGPARIEYIQVVDSVSLQPVGQIGGPVLLALAVRIGAARLIDNLVVDPADPRP